MSARSPWFLLALCGCICLTGCDSGDGTDREAAQALSRHLPETVVSGAADAREKGASFWAVGNEPAWYLAVFPQQQLLFVSDYGNTVTRVPDPGAEMEESSVLYRVETATDALQVELLEQPCQDSMSGEVFTFQVTVNHNETLYGGCGRDL